MFVSIKNLFKNYCGWIFHNSIEKVYICMFKIISHCKYVLVDK